MKSVFDCDRKLTRVGFWPQRYKYFVENDDELADDCDKLLYENSNDCPFIPACGTFPSK